MSFNLPWSGDEEDALLLELIEAEEALRGLYQDDEDELQVEPPAVLAPASPQPIVVEDNESDSSESDSSDDEDWEPRDLFSDNQDEGNEGVNEYSIAGSEDDMENEDGGYDDDTDAEAEENDVVILNADGTSDTENDEEDNAPQSDNEDDNGDEPAGPPRKVAKMDNPEGPSTSATAKQKEDDDSDGLSCSICYDQFTNSGEHRISCLKCGHVFGKNCIEKWLKIHGRCPQCNCKAIRKDVRILYVKSLMAVDNTEVTEAKREVDQAKILISKYSLENAKLRITVETKNRQMKVLEEENQYNKRTITALQMKRTNPSSSITSQSGGQSVLPSDIQSSSKASAVSRKQFKLTLAKFWEIKEGLCRVAAYNENLNLMVVSHDMKNPLFPNGCCGIKQINMLELRPTLSTPIHQKQIRDLQFSPSQRDVLLTVALDKKAILYNCNGNVTIQTFNTDYPLWSCTWDDVKQHLFYVGCNNGQIIAYDIRNPLTPYATYLQGTDTSPVCRIKYVRPTYRSNSFNLSGLLVQQLNSVTFREPRENCSEMKLHHLPLDGPFLNIDFEPVSRHILASSRPRSDLSQSTSNHYVCDLTQYYDENLESNVVSCNLLRTYQGTNVQKMGRSSLFSPSIGSVYLMANGMQNTVNYWDVASSPDMSQSVNNAPEYVMDFVHGRVNSTNFLGLVSERGVRILQKSFTC